MKRLGIDFGSKKIGIAITDDSGSMAFPLSVVPNDNNFMSYIESLVKERGVEEIVIGHSLDNKGNPNSVHELVTEFIANMTMRSGIPIHLEPEHYSTKQAIHLQGKTNLVDASAAAIILESFITKQNKI